VPEEQYCPLHYRGQSEVVLLPRPQRMGPRKRLPNGHLPHRPGSL